MVEGPGCFLFLLPLLRLCNFFFLKDALDFAILIVYERMDHFDECFGG